MSLTTYIGCNIEIPLIDENSDDNLLIKNCFSDEEHKRNVLNNHFSTPYIFEVSTGGGIEILTYRKTRHDADSKRKIYGPIPRIRLNCIVVNFAKK